MASFEIWDIVKVPFPYTDRPVRQRRPALVIAAGQLAEEYGLLWVAMITSAANRGWDGDVLISNNRATGLPIPSIVRPAKIATLDASDAEPLGKLPSRDRVSVAKCLAALLAPVLASQHRRH